MAKLLEFLDSHTARNLFRSSHLKVKRIKWTARSLLCSRLFCSFILLKLGVGKTRDGQASVTVVTDMSLVFARY